MTAETAMVLPLVALFTVAMAWMVCVGITQVRALDAAREVARAAARSESGGQALALGRQVAPAGSRISVQRGPDTVVATRGQPGPGTGGHRGPAGRRATSRGRGGRCRGAGAVSRVRARGSDGPRRGDDGAARRRHRRRRVRRSGGGGPPRGAGSGRPGGARRRERPAGRAATRAPRQRAIAGRNRAELRACQVEGWTVSVVVVVGGRLPVGTMRLPAPGAGRPGHALRAGSALVVVGVLALLALVLVELLAQLADLLAVGAAGAGSLGGRCGTCPRLSTRSSSVAAPRKKTRRRCARG